MSILLVLSLSSIQLPSPGWTGRGHSFRCEYLLTVRECPSCVQQFLNPGGCNWTRARAVKMQGLNPVFHLLRVLDLILKSTSHLMPGHQLLTDEAQCCLSEMQSELQCLN